MRNILVVSNDLYNLIPNDYDNTNKFYILKHNIKKHIIDSIPFSEPQMIKSNHYWNKLSYYINNAINFEDYGNISWCKNFIDIFQDPTYKCNL